MFTFSHEPQSVHISACAPTDRTQVKCPLSIWDSVPPPHQHIQVRNCQVEDEEKETVPCPGAVGSVEFDGQVRSVFAEELAVVVVHGPEGGQVARLHGAEEVLPPAPLQVHQAPQAVLGVRPDHLQAVRHVRLIQDP